MLRRIRPGCQIAGLVLGIAVLAAAAVFPRLTAEELTAQSKVIVQGTVVRSWAAWDSEHKYIWTHYQISLGDVIRGGRATTFTVSEPGGTLDGITQVNTGAIAYRSGETDILFLAQMPNGYWRAAGGPQGKFVIEANGRVRGGAQGAALADRFGRRATGTALPSLDGLTVAQFKTRVRQLAAAHPFQGQ